MTNIESKTSFHPLWWALLSFYHTVALTKIPSAGLVVTALTLILHPVPTFSQAARIFMDGDLSDWQNLIPLYSDSIGDQVSGDIDFGRLWVANDERFLFLHIEVGTEISLQNGNDITLFLDTDNNPSTGTQVYGIGAEFEWNFGNRTGFFVIGIDSLSIYEVQYTTDQGTGNDCYPSPLVGQTVTLSGVVTAVEWGQYSHFWLQDKGDPWYGVFSYDTMVSPQVGDSLTVTAEVDEYHGMTETKDISEFNIHKHSCSYDTIDIHTGDLGTECSFHGEAYEGCLVRVCNVGVTRSPDQYNQWYVDDGSGECQIDDSCYPVEFDSNWQDTCLCITGVVNYSYGEYEINPRGEEDIVQVSCDASGIISSPERLVFLAPSSLFLSFPNPFNQSSPISHNDIGLVTAPTVTSTQFEIAIDRYVQPVSQRPLIPGNTIRIVFADTTGGDLLPDLGMSITYTFDNTPLPPLPSLTFGRSDTNHLRMLTYNVLSDGFFDPSRLQYYDRILNALKPDFIGFQEIYEHSAEQTAAQVESILPSTGEQQWYSSKAGPDVISISRYPILSTYPIDGNGAFLIDLRPRYDTDLLLIVVHLPCCEYDTERQLEIDAIMAFIRDAKAPGGILDLQPGTPIVIMGDMNLVGYKQQLETLLSGEIVNVDLYGPPFAPDWDGTDFADLLPRLTDLPMLYTWYDDNSSFSPGRLDFIIYSDCVLDSGNHFVLFTPEMAPDSLAAYGLQPEDVVLASDHLPVVGDFSLPTDTTDIQLSVRSFQPVSLSLEQNYPNPFNPSTTIRYHLSALSSERTAVRPHRTTLQIYNITGQLVRALVDEKQPAGDYRILWDGRDNSGNEVSSGVYFCRLKIEGEKLKVERVGKMVILR